MKQQGFTLLETLVVLTIAGLVLGVIFNIFNIALFGLERSSQEVKWQQELRTLETLMHRDLNSLFKGILSEDDYFVGSYQQLSFLILEENKLKKVNYQYDPYQGTLFRELLTEDNEVIEKLVFFSELKLNSVDFNFYDQSAGYWVNNWSLASEKYLPTLVKIDFTKEDKELPDLVLEIYLGREY